MSAFLKLFKQNRIVYGKIYLFVCDFLKCNFECIINRFRYLYKHVILFEDSRPSFAYGRRSVAVYQFIFCVVDKISVELTSEEDNFTSSCWETMNPQCAKCLKTVYPVEKLNCLDKVRSGLKDEISESKHANLSHKKYNNEEENQSIKILNREQEFLHFRSSFFLGTSCKESIV